VGGAVLEQDTVRGTAQIPADTLTPIRRFAWQEPGFAQLFLERGVTAMGEPIDIPYADELGNVFQESAAGCALWLKQYNQNF
jgi:hypothetical protein